MARYVIRGGREGYERLQVLHRSRWADTRDLFEQVGVAEGMRCVDLGCGGGEVTFELARLVGPSGHVTGIDLDDVKLDLAKESENAQELRNVELRDADVAEWDEPGAYDLVYCRFLLEHLSSPVDLLRRMWAAVAPGGAIAVESTDFDGQFGEPPNDAFEEHERLYRAVAELRGGDPTAGRKMFRYFIDAGVPRPQVRIVQRVDSEGEAKSLAVLTFQAVAGPVVDEGLATAEEVEATLAGLEAFTTDPETLVAQPRIFQLWRRRN
ncbi:MAG TPA: methyltransferase domain-containing protein [Gaiellaceae bacterium]